MYNMNDFKCYIFCNCKLSDDKQSCVLDLPFKTNMALVVHNNVNYYSSDIPKDFVGQDVIAWVSVDPMDAEQVRKHEGYIGDETDIRVMDDPRFNKHSPMTVQDKTNVVALKAELEAKPKEKRVTSAVSFFVKKDAAGNVEPVKEAPTEEKEVNVKDVK